MERRAEPRHGFEEMRERPATTAGAVVYGPLVAVLLGPNGPPRAALEARLRAEGFDVRASPGALDAHETALVLLLDVGEEERSTITDACRAARAVCLDDCFIVVATERNEEAHLRALVDAGADDVFVLPHDEPRLGPRLAALRRRISATRRVENALSGMHEELEALIAAFPDDLYRIAEDDEVLDAHVSAWTRRRVAASSLVGKRIDELMPPPQAALFLEAASLARATKKVVTLELDYAPELHDIREVRVVALPNGHVLALSRDVTEQRRAEAALRRAELALRDSERLARAVFENTPIGIQVYGPDGTSLRMNEAQRRQLGLPSVDYGIGQFNALTDPLFVASGAAREFARAFAGEIVELHDRNFDLGVPENVWATDRKCIVIDTILFPIREGDDTIAVVAFCRDVTERRLAAARLLLADRLASLGTMAAGVAHEINNPLAFILANLEFITSALRDPALDEPTRLQASQAVAESIEGARRMRAIVRELSTFSRAEEDGEQQRPVDVHRVLEASVRIAQHTILHRATVRREFGAKGSVLGNEPRLGQVFVNLLVNAVQAMPERSQSENDICIVTRDERGSVVVEVHDNGVGIPPERLRRVFDPFFTTKPVGEGTGLGLSVCHSIITTLGGEIGVRSEPGAGSVFLVTLPAAPASPVSPAEAPGRGDDAPTETRLKVLFVDDEPFVCAAVRRMIGREFDLVCASGPDEALVHLGAAERFDAILCDLMMPGSSGDSLYRALCALDPSLDRRVGFLTGGAFTDDVQAFAADAGDRLLFKPFEADALRALVRALAAGKLPPLSVR